MKYGKSATDNRLIGKNAILLLTFTFGDTQQANESLKPRPTEPKAREWAECYLNSAIAIAVYDGKQFRHEVADTLVGESA